MFIVMSNLTMMPAYHVLVVSNLLSNVLVFVHFSLVKAMPVYFSFSCNKNQILSSKGCFIFSISIPKQHYDEQ